MLYLTTRIDIHQKLVSVGKDHCGQRQFWLFIMCVLFVDIGIFIARHLVIKLDELWIKNATVSIYLSPSVELEFV